MTPTDVSVFVMDVPRSLRIRPRARVAVLITLWYVVQMMAMGWRPRCPCARMLGSFHTIRRPSPWLVTTDADVMIVVVVIHRHAGSSAQHIVPPRWYHSSPSDSI